MEVVRGDNDRKIHHSGTNPPSLVFPRAWCDEQREKRNFL